MGMSEAEKKRAQRERARKEGKCIVCRNLPARPGMSTCEPCNEEAKERVRRSRGAAGKPKPKAKRKRKKS